MAGKEPNQKPIPDAVKPTQFEAFVSAILKVPKDEIVEAEGKRLKRTAPKSKMQNR